MGSSHQKKKICWNYTENQEIRIKILFRSLVYIEGRFSNMKPMYVQLIDRLMISGLTRQEADYLFLLAVEDMVSTIREKVGGEADFLESTE